MTITVKIFVSLLLKIGFINNREIINKLERKKKFKYFREKKSKMV